MKLFQISMPFAPFEPEFMGPGRCNGYAISCVTFELSKHALIYQKIIMNYFDVYELPVQFVVDKQVLKQKYFELSRQHHPDYFAQQDEAAQQQALEKSAVINKAFKTFSNRDETIKYVLELKGLLTENEKYNLPPDFLMEMMELNEQLAEAQFDPAEKSAVLQAVLQTEAALYEPVKEIVENYVEGQTSDAQLLQVKEYYFKKKYLERLKQQLGEKS